MIFQKAFFAVLFSIISILLFSSTDSRSESTFSLDKMSPQQISEWNAREKSLRNDHAVCVEHCGGKKDCEAACRRALDARLRAAYNGITGGLASRTPPEDLSSHSSCPFCGMDRKKFSHSRVFIVFDDGTKSGTCSIHCAAIELALNIDKTPKEIWVGDFDTRQLVDAEKAYWVIGGDKPGVMTKRAKWAFETREKADAFIKSSGGKISVMDEAFKAAFEDMYEDTRMIIERRKMKRMKEQKTGR
jgi:nitrous oxide reductase accessory protein NosL